MFNQDTFGEYSTGLIEILDLVQLELIGKISRQLAKGETLNDDDWKLLMMNQYAGLQRSIARTIEVSGPSQAKEIEGIKKKAISQGLKDTDKQLARLGKVQSPEFFITQNEEILKTVSAKLTDDMVNANLTMLRESGQDYLKIVNQVLAKKELGAISRTEATKQIVSQWSKKGIPALKDSLGRRWAPDAYANMVVRTNSLQIAKKTQERRAVDYGYDLILTSQHGDQSPEHAPYANKIYSLTGNDPKFPPFSEATSNGFMTRPNCRHTYSFYFVGDKPKKLTGTNKNYKKSQQQRKLERDIRALKRERAGLQGLGEDLTDINRKIRAKQADMRTFINETGRTRRREREQI